MLSSIHPLGERGRRNKWGITVAAFTLAAMATGALVGLGLGALGATLFATFSHTALIWITLGSAIIAGLLDLSHVSPPGTERQVNESWIGHYRGWVYGGSFGFELGTGVMTYIVTWGVYATFLGEMATADPLSGALVGAVFGFGRSLALLAAGWIDRPSRLTRFHEAMADLGPPIQRLSAGGTVVAGTVTGALTLI